MKHTLGPWYISGGWVIRGSHGELIVEVPGDETLDNTLDSNRHLIAAAPDLLEALENVLDLASPFFTDSVQTLAFSEALKAVAKAKGEK